MQQEAVAGLREMQSKVRAGEEAPRFRNWSTDPNVSRENRTPRKREEPRPPQQPQVSGAPSQWDLGPPVPRQGGGRQSAYQQARRYEARREEAKREEGPYQARQGEPFRQKNAEPPPPQAPSPKDTTLLQDILGAVGLDDDRILILGLILILINDKADTTLILALCYLLL